MLRLTHYAGPRRGHVEQFAFAPVRIGSDDRADIQVPHVAALAVEISVHGGAPLVVDRGGGLFVQGARVASYVLGPQLPFAVGAPNGPMFLAELTGPVGERPATPDGRVDLATAQQIIADAIRQQAERGKKPTNQVVAEKVKQATSGGRRRLSCLAVAAVGSLFALLIAVGFVYRSQRDADILVSEAGLGEDAKKPKGKLPTKTYSGREIYEDNRDALYVIAYVKGNRIGGCCTAFAIDDDLLATNAHCVEACKEKGGELIVVQNESKGRVTFPVVDTEVHDDYDHDNERANTPDVAYLEVRGKLPRVVELANEAELFAIGPGDDAYIVGFPGRVMDPTSPSATFLHGHIGRTTDLDGEPAAGRDGVLIQHDAVTRGGNSGSPVFNQYGHVIAVHTAHIDDEDKVRINGEEVTVVESSPYRVGMRIDLLEQVDRP